MQEFLLHDTVNCNLMSLTGYRTLFLLRLLMESPKSTEEINQLFLNNKYIKETFSTDTLRIYINSLKMIGCEISRANKSTNNKYILLSHPFEFDVPKVQIKALSKLYKNIYDKINIKEIIAIENLFEAITALIKNEKTRDLLKSFSMLKNINRDILKELANHCNKHNQIVFLYKSPNSGEKEIEIVADKIEFKSDKLYIWGHSLSHGEYSYFRLDRILKILTIALKKEEKEIPQTKVIFEVYNRTKSHYHEDANEKIIERTAEKVVVESVSKNKFNLVQKILYMAQDCKVIHPDGFKQEIAETLQSMQRSYNFEAD